jgi:hypothetical protein
MSTPRRGAQAQVCREVAQGRFDAALPGASALTSCQSATAARGGGAHVDATADDAAPVRVLSLGHVGQLCGRHVRVMAARPSTAAAPKGPSCTVVPFPGKLPCATDKYSTEAAGRTYQHTWVAARASSQQRRHKWPRSQGSVPRLSQLALRGVRTAPTLTPQASVHASWQSVFRNMDAGLAPGRTFTPPPTIAAGQSLVAAAVPAGDVDQATTP